MKLNVPFFKQDTPYTCGPASIQMAMDFFGFFEGEKQLKKEVHADYDIGTTHKWMMDVVKKKGFYCREENESTLDDVCFLLNEKLPVIVHFTEPSENATHYSVVTGIENGAVILNDPWNGKDYRISEEEFLERWRSPDGQYTRWLMVISRHPIVFDDDILIPVGAVHV